MRRTVSNVCALAVGILLVIGCGTPPAVPTTFVSPLPTLAGAGPTQSDLPQGPLFSLDEPLKAGDVQVTGQGPRGMTIAIADITYMGEVLGRGRIGEDGRFSVEIGPPLIVNHLTGIMLDATATEIQYTPELLAALERFRGDNAITLPRVGEAYDAASVQP